MYRIKKTNVLLIFILLFVGCTVNKDITKPNIEYKKTLSFKVNDQSFVGVGVPNHAKTYKIEVSTPFKLNFLKIESCHRAIVLKNAYHKKRILKNHKKYIFNYNPIGLERECILLITALNEKGKSKFGQIVLKNKSYNVSAKSYCNGEFKKTEGVTMCQGKAGLIQLIEFENKMIAQSNCPIMALKDKKTFRYDLESGDCVFLFVGKDRAHKLITFGYDEVLLEEE